LHIQNVSEVQAGFHKQILSLQLTWNCNAACRQCMVTGKADRSRVMTIDEAKRVIDQLEDMPFTRFVGFTGGEVFLYRDMLLELGRYVRDRFGYHFGAATNAYWAETTEKAREVLEPLVDLGLGELLFSLDDFHLEFIDGARVENAVRAALLLGVDVTVQTIKTRTGHDSAYFRAHLDIPPAPQVRWVETPCHPAGRAVSQVPANEYFYDWTNHAGRCTALRVWSVDPYGTVVPCCGTAFCRPLRIGNAFRDDLAAIVQRANVDPLLNTVAAWGGPYMLIKTLEQHGDFRYSTRQFASHCHACDVVLRDREAVKLFERELPPHWLEALSSRLVAQALWYRAYVFEEPNCHYVPGGWIKDEAQPTTA
jgi:hypothetical protein